MLTKTDLNKYLTTNYVNLEIAVLCLKYRTLNVYKLKLKLNLLLRLSELNYK